VPNSEVQGFQLLAMAKNIKITGKDGTMVKNIEEVI